MGDLNLNNNSGEENGNEIYEAAVSKKPKRGVLNNSTPKEVKINSPKPKQDKCPKCKQYLNELLFYNGHPNNSMEEFIALTDEKLSIFSDKEDFEGQQDDFPTHKITHFSIYDKNGHLCPIDTGLVDDNVELYFSGYIKPIFDEDCSLNNGIPAHDLGPINEWWTAGYDGGEILPIGLSTAYAEYYLLEPSPEYEPIFTNLHKKIHLSKIIIEFLLDRGWENPSYEDLLEHVTSFEEYDEDVLLQNAQFLCDQVLNYDKGSSEEEHPMISYPCMRTLVKISGVTFGKRKRMRKQETKLTEVKKKGPAWTKATTTKLVRDVFESFFPDQLDKASKGPKKKRCGVCEACQNPDCGQCNHCLDMLKFGGTGKSKQACKQRRCPNMEIMEAEMSDNEEEVDVENKTEPVKKKGCSKRILHKVKFDKEAATVVIKGRQCYSSAVVGDITVVPGDYVMLSSETPDEPLMIAQIAYMCDIPLQGPSFHAHYFCRGADTILGETADSRELFTIDSCEDCPLGSIVRKAEVVYKEVPKNWFELGGEVNLQGQAEDDGKFFFTKRYEGHCSRFVDYVPEKADDQYPCVSCKHKKLEKRFQTPILENEKVVYKGETYKVGSCVYLKPETYKFDVDDPDTFQINKENVNETLYPEFWRKKSDTIKGSNLDTPDPFIIGLIEEISGKQNDIRIKVRIFCRPATTRSVFLEYTKDLNYIYWTDEVKHTQFSNVIGKCYIAHEDNIINKREWEEQGPDRFYFNESYNPKSNVFSDVPAAARRVGQLGKSGKGGKVKGKSSKTDKEADLPIEWPTVDRSLRCMDIFAGCGGLSEGLHEAGIADTKWAIEKEMAAAQAFRLNYPDCKVITEDCNEVLKIVMAGEGETRGFPGKGEVELMIGGPPCQGFSGMNRFNAGQYSVFKNSLVVTYLSFCDYYRPRYFILENVRNFVSFKRSIVLKLTLRCLLAMGYQVAFGVLQAGNYGVPQTRRRLVLLGAAPGYTLPRYPEPKHVFSRRGCQLSFVVDGVRYDNGIKWTSGAPYRTICVRDALSDLPDIVSGWSKNEMPYDCGPVSHFQKKMRGNEEEGGLVKDHICKEMSAIVEGRIAQVPTYPGADWRDIPNITVKLKDGTVTNLLRYPYRTKKQKKDEPPRGVCHCATGGPCDPSDRQLNTLIPWCLPHTADRHNHWAALYGRLEWDGYFGTTITNPEPMGKQGRVLHPEQNRVVSVRECARSQGFPDRFKFFGNVLDKHRQVGNAVPPPLGAALGREIRKAYSETLKQQKNRR